MCIYVYYLCASLSFFAYTTKNAERCVYERRQLYLGSLYHWSDPWLLFNNNKNKVLISSLFLLTPYVGNIVEFYQCGFWSTQLTTDQIFCINHLVEVQWDSRAGVYVLKACNFVGREVLCDILFESIIIMKLVRLIKMLLTLLYENRIFNPLYYWVASARH